MAKRTSLSERREKDGTRGVELIFNGAASAEAALPQQAGDGPSAITAPGKVKPETAKVTIYVRPDQVVSIEAIQLAQRQRTGNKPDKSQLIQEALDLLIEKYSSM